MTAHSRELERLLTCDPAAVVPLPPSEYLVYGAGNVGRQIAGLLCQRGHRMAGFVDERPLGTVDGYPVHAPELKGLTRLATHGATAVLGVFNYTVDPWPLYERLRQAGFTRVVTFHELHELFDLQPHFWLTRRRHVQDHAPRIREAWSLLDDDESRRVFLDVIRLRVTGDLSLLREPAWGRQYLPDDLPKPCTSVRFIDGGAFTGDTLEFLASEGLSFEAVAAFEPDPENYPRLCHSIAGLGSVLGDVSVWPCGLSDRTGLATFRSGQGAGSTVAPDGDVHVQLVSLDDALPAFAPDYVKLDIEGHELAALRGASRMLRQHQPRVAACLYHRPEDLWEIPIYLRELLPRHRLVVRYHTYQAFELVAYAVPGE